MNNEKKIILIIGKRGSGKTYLARKLIAEHQRLFIYDVMSEYTEGVIFGPEDWPTLAAFWKRVYRRPFRIIYRPIEDEAEMQVLARLIYALGNVTFLVEEVDTVAQSYSIPYMFRRIIRRGRHRDITLIGVTPSPYGIHRDLTRQAKEIYIFRTNEPRDIAYLKDLLRSDIEARLSQLDQYQYAYWAEGQEAFTIGRA